MDVGGTSGTFCRVDFVVRVWTLLNTFRRPSIWTILFFSWSTDLTDGLSLNYIMLGIACTFIFCGETGKTRFALGSGYQCKQHCPQFVGDCWDFEHQTESTWTPPLSADHSKYLKTVSVFEEDRTSPSVVATIWVRSRISFPLRLSFWPWPTFFWFPFLTFSVEIALCPTPCISGCVSLVIVPSEAALTFALLKVTGNLAPELGEHGPVHLALSQRELATVSLLLNLAAL